MVVPCRSAIDATPPGAVSPIKKLTLDADTSMAGFFPRSRMFIGMTVVVVMSPDVLVWGCVVSVGVRRRLVLPDALALEETGPEDRLGVRGIFLSPP